MFDASGRAGERVRRRASEYDGAELRPWQAELAAELDGPTHPRRIIWYVDYAGDAGKSWFTGYCLSTRGPRQECMMRGGRVADMLYEYGLQRVVLVDLARVSPPQGTIAAVEQIKDGAEDE